MLQMLNERIPVRSDFQMNRISFAYQIVNHFHDTTML